MLATVTCQESYRRLSSRLGCCGGTWFANPSPLSSFERFFNSCSVTLDEQCAPASGAGVLYLSMLLVVSASLHHYSLNSITVHLLVVQIACVIN